MHSRKWGLSPIARFSTAARSSLALSDEVLSKWGLAPFLLLLSAAVHAADFDAAGRLTSITHDGRTIPLLAGFVLDLGDGKTYPIAPFENAKLTREADTWRGLIKLPRGALGLEASWTDIPGKLRFKGKLRANKKVSIHSIDYVFHLPRDLFAGGQLLRVQAEDGGDFRSPIRLTPAAAAEGNFVREKTAGVTFLDARKNWSIGIQLPAPLDVSVDELPGARGGATYRVTARIHEGALPAGTDIPVQFTLSIVGKSAPAAPPAKPN
jgi:hypothetical protein